jgi:hypothetical protein
MPKATYPITLRNATPETTPLGELAKLIEKLDVAIIETARDRNIELPEDEAVVSLVNIEKGSNRLIFTLAPFMWPILAELANSIEEGDFVALPTKAHNALYDISRQAKKQHWDVLFPENQDHENQDQMYHIHKTEISTQRPITPPKPQFIKGTTTIFGMCMGVGGKTPKVDLSLSNRGRLLRCETTREIAVRLSRSLYKNVALYGQALWNPDTWELVKFKATEIANQVHDGSPEKALEEVSKVVGDQWKDVDVVEFVNNVRSGDTGRDGA